MSVEVKNLFDNKSKGWDDKYDSNGELVKRLKRFTEFVYKFTNPNFLLDAGCGSGIFVKYFNDKGVDVVGVDLSEGMIQYCKSKDYNYPDKVKFYCGHLENLTLEEKKFDSAISSSVIEYVDNDEKYLCSISELLEKDAYLFITVPNKDNAVRKKEAFFKKIKFLFYPFSFFKKISNYLVYLEVSKNRYNVEEFKKLSENLGFEMISYEGFNPTENSDKLLSSTLIIFVLKKL